MISLSCLPMGLPAPLLVVSLFSFGLLLTSSLRLANLSSSQLRELSSYPLLIVWLGLHVNDHVTPACLRQGLNLPPTARAAFSVLLFWRPNLMVATPIRLNLQKALLR
jgi:hypothetical protein